VSRLVRRVVQVALWAIMLPYVVLCALAFAVDAWNGKEPLPPEETSIPSVRVGAVGRPVDPPPPADPIAPPPSTLRDRAVRFMKRQGGAGRLAAEEANFRDYAVLAEDITRRSLDVEPELVLAISFRESSWDPSAEGKAGEIGLMQLKGRDILQGYATDAVRRSPSLQLYLGVRRFEAALDACDGRIFAALLQYASGKCEGPINYETRERAIASANRVLRWAESMRRDR
jgi:hypothetical protein